MTEEDLPFGMIVFEMMKHFLKVLKKEMNHIDGDSTIEQMGLLIAISTNKKCIIQQDMADLLGKDKSSILRTIDTLEKRSLLIRIKDPKDRRKNIINITDLGKQTLKQHFEMERILTKSMLKGISEKELESFYYIIARIKRNAEKM